MFSAQSRLRHAVADTFAMVVYCTVVNMMIEIFLSGMTFEQSLSSRLVAIPVNIIIAVPYGIYRDFAMRQARRISPARWMKNMADVLAYYPPGASHEVSLFGEAYYFELNIDFHFTMKFDDSGISSYFFNFFQHDFLPVDIESLSQ